MWRAMPELVLTEQKMMQFPTDFRCFLHAGNSAIKICLLPSQVEVKKH